MVSCDFCRAIEISDKREVGPSNTLKRNFQEHIFWEQCIAINQVSREYQWPDICVVFISVVWPTYHLTVLANQRSSKPSSKYIISYF